jgi:hypothetical protein
VDRRIRSTGPSECRARYHSIINLVEHEHMAELVERLTELQDRVSELRDFL